MKKHISKIALGSFLAISIFCYSYLNCVEANQPQSQYQYEEYSETKDRMVSGFKSATVVLGRVVDFITKRDVS